MRRLASALVAFLLFFAPPMRSTAQDAGPMHAPDFRAQQFLIAIYFGLKPNAPFVAIAKTVWVKFMPDNSTITTWNKRYIARDADGRIVQERRTLVPDDSKQQPKVRVLEYTDPQEHTFYICNPYSKICNLSNYYVRESNTLTPEGLQPDGMSYLTREDLGVDSFVGLEVPHSRETFTYFKQTIGNTKTILRTIEYWYSLALGVNMQVKRHDPHDGDQTLWLTNISLSTTDSEKFKIPEGNRIIDYRNARRDSGVAATDPH